LSVIARARGARQGVEPEPAAARRAHQRRRERVDRAVGDGLQQCVAGRKVVGEVALAYARCARDARLRQLRRAAAREQGERSVEDPLAHLHLGNSTNPGRVLIQVKPPEVCALHHGP
jgi:hypothetical protein